MSATWFPQKGDPGAAGATGATGATGAAGATGATGAFGGAITTDYKFSSTTTNSDPGAGFLRFNTGGGNQVGASALYVSYTDQFAASQLVLFGVLDVSTTTAVRARFRIFKKSDPSVFLYFYLTGAKIDHGGAYAEFPIGSGFGSDDAPFANNDELLWAVDITGDKGASGTADELEPMDLAMHEIANIDPFNVQPTALLQFADDMSVTTLARFTQLTDSGVASVTPTIASNLITFNMPVSQQTDNTLQEGAAITMPQFFASIRVSSVTHSGADTNGGENVSVGICKTANPGDFIFALWRRKQGTFGAASIQVKLAGVQNLRGDITLGAAWVPPFDMALSCVSNSLTFWQRPNGGTWTVITSWPLSEIDLRTADLTAWKPGFRITSGNTVQASFNLTNFNFGPFGAVGMRDLVPVTNEAGDPIFTGDKITLTATCEDPAAAAYCGVFTYDFVSRVLTQTGVLMVSRGGGIYNDNAAHIIDLGGTYRFFITTWGNTGAANIQILYKNETVLNLLSGSRVVASMTQQTLPGLGSGGVYDPFVIKVGSTYYLAGTVGPVAANSYYPSLWSSTDLSTWTQVGADTAAFPYEGTRIINLNGAHWVLSSHATAFANVYDLAMVYQGKFAGFFTVAANASPPHATLVPHGQYVHQLTFDTTLYASVASTNGHVRHARARRYAAHGP